MGKVITIANNKGGCGKTATATTLAAGFAKRGRRTLLIDLDGQANATLCLRIPTTGGTALDLLTGGTVTPAQLAPSLWGIPSCNDMNIIERLADLTRGDAVAKALKPLAGKYDYIILDTTPALELPTINALKAADRIIIPLQASFVTVQGVGGIIDALRALNKAEAFAIVVTMYNSRLILHRQLLDAVRDTYGAQVCRTPIRQSVAIQEAPASGQSILDYAPGNTVAQDYNALITELLERFEA